MCQVSIGGVVRFSANEGVWLDNGAERLDPLELHRVVGLAFEHVKDAPLVEAGCGGRGPLAQYSHLTFEEYLAALQQIAVGELTAGAKRKHTLIRRRAFNTERSRLVLLLIENGTAYQCAERGCGTTRGLTVDHRIPLSRGGSDTLANLQFLCRVHNSTKGDHLGDDTCPG